MGVPSLFRWISDKCTDSVYDATIDQPTDMLYLDFNGIIHRSCNPPLAPKPQSEEEILQNIRKYLDNIMRLVHPTTLLYISIDGVAPRAKLNQQRSRRFQTGLEAAAGDQQESGFKFETNAITPGTEFMRNVDSFLQELIKYKLSNEWAHLTVIYSNSDVPGEGEQKILNFIREQNFPEDLFHTIYSPDADLTFLALTLDKVKVKILRNNQQFESKQSKSHCTHCNKLCHNVDFCDKYESWKYVYFEVKIYREFLISLLKSKITRKFRNQSMINDFIFLSFLAGNDFVHSLQCFNIRYGAMDNILFLLSQNFIKTGEYITNGDRVIWSNTKYLMFLLSKNENSFYYTKLKKLRETRKFSTCEENPEEILLHTDAGKDLYYDKKLHFKTRSELNNLCKSYLLSLDWTFAYYLGKLRSWEYYYAYHYPPMACDLVRCESFSPRYIMGKPLKQLEQLIAVMPHTSHKIVPKPLTAIFTEFKGFYPDKVDVDLFDKNVIWQGVVLLPFMDLNTVLPRVKDIVATLKTDVIDRNVLGRPLLYISSNNMSYSQIYEFYLSGGVHFELNGGMLSAILHQNYCVSLPGEARIFKGIEYINDSISAILGGP